MELCNAWGSAQTLSIQIENVEDIYSLAPMQQAMLLHTVTRREDRSLSNQFCYELAAALDLPVFQRAWELLVERHTSLRTAFVWGRKTAPMQVVRKKVTLDFSKFDWTDLSKSEQTKKFAELCDSERARLIDLSRPPLMRVAIAAIADRKFLLLWSCHHLILDRWCIGTVWTEVLTLYATIVSGSQPALPSARPFSDYIAWIKRQPAGVAEQYWRAAMEGFSRPSLVTEKAPEGRLHQSFSFELSCNALKQASDFARSNGVTLNVLLQGALGISLNRICKSQDIVFGMTVSGRPPDIAGVESMLGSFVSNVPVRVRLSPRVSVSRWLRDLQNNQQLRSAHEFVAPADVHSWVELSAAVPLFDTLLVTLAPVDAPNPSEIKVQELDGHLQTALPLTISIEEGDDFLRLRAIVGAGRRTCIPPERILQILAESVTAIAKSSGQTMLGELDGFFGDAGLFDSDATSQSNYLPIASVPPESTFRTGGREMIDAPMMQDLLQYEWERVLDDTEIGPDDNFFEIGGTSLMAASMHAQIESLARVKIPIITLFQEPTIREMSAMLVSDEWPNVGNCILPVRDGKPATTPLLMIASPEVNSVGYALLARHLNKGRRAYVVQAPPESHELSRLSPVILPEIAASYLAEVRAIQPDGPYYLIGMCTGSQLAFEMAKQFRKAGELVPYVGIINTWAHYTVTRWYNVAWAASRCKYYLHRMWGLARMPVAERNETVRRIVGRRMRVQSGDAVTESAVPSQPLGGAPAVAPEGTDAVTNARHDPWIQDFGWEHNDTGIDKYPGTITVYRIRSQQRWRTGDRDLGWGRHAIHTLVEDLSGKHHVEILREPQVRDLARRICIHLTRCDVESKQQNEKYGSHDVRNDSLPAQGT